MSRDRIIQVYRGTTAQNDAFTGAAGEITMDTTRKELRVHDGSTAGGNLVGLKPGFVCPFAGTTAPDGWLICDGSAVSRTTYADLFAVIGTTYGAGDGNSTFNLPNYSNAKLIVGNNIPVKGNGMTLGLFDGRNSFALAVKNLGGQGSVGGYINRFNKAIGDTAGGSSSYTGGGAGLTTDPNLSGIIADISNMQSVNYAIKY